MTRAIVLLANALIAVALCATASAHEATELEQRQDISTRTQLNFENEDFDKLDQDADRYVRERSRLPSGTWKLYWFNHGLAAAAFKDIPKTDFEPAYAALEAKVKRWTTRHPNSAAAHILYSQVLVAHGWSYRGGGYASTVKDEAWAPFRRYLELGRQYLEQHKRIASRDPSWYEEMAEIAKAQSWPVERFEKMLDEGLKREPLAYQIYFSALSYYTPKWHGDLDALDNFARAAVKRTRNLEGNSLYARIYWSASGSCCELKKDIFANSNVDWATMREGFDDMIAHYPDPWNIASYASFACNAQDKATTRKIMDRPDYVLVPAAWQGKLPREYCEAWARQ